MNKKLIVVTLIIILATTLSLVTAEEAGIITFNINDSSNSQVNVNISNSTITGQTNYTNTQATQNITLTNSTLTLNVNGQNITISSKDDNLVIITQNQSTTNANPRPTLTVSFLGSQPTTHSIISGNGTIEYDFNITVNVPTSMNYPFGVNATTSQISKALLPLVENYNLVVNNFNGDGNITSAQWVDKPIVDGMNTFSLFSYEQLNATQTESMTNDLFGAFTAAMNGTA